MKTTKRDVSMTWEIVKLGDIVKMVTGKTPPTSNINYFDGVYLWVNPSDFGSKFIIESKRTITQKALDEKKCNLLPKGTVLLSCIGDIGKTGILKTHGTSNQQITGLITKENVYPDYLFYYLIHNKSQLESLANKAVVAILNNERLRDLDVTLPPLHVQKRIAEILDTADALKRKDQELLKKYDELAQAIFIDMFGDPVKNDKKFEFVDLESLCEDIIDCPHTTPIHTEIASNYPCIRTSEMKNGKIIWDKMKYLNYKNYLLRVKRLVPKAGDIVYAREGTYGEAVIIPEGFEFALGQRTMLFRPNPNKCDNYFIWHFINSNFVYKQAQRKNMGSTVGHVNVADVKKFQILLPPIELQREFGNILRIINKLLESVIVKSQSLNLFDSLIQKAFKGELVSE